LASSIGRTKTTPRKNDNISGIGLGVFSCSQYTNGYFNAYGNAAWKDDVDYMVHLGDYIYEGPPSANRTERIHEPRKIISTLYDYLTRLGQYPLDADLQLNQQRFAWIPVWDDHEVSNNGYRDGSSALNNTEDSFLRNGGVSVDQRKMNAVRAYFE